MKAVEMSTTFSTWSSAPFCSMWEVEMLSVAPSPALPQFREGPCWVAHSKTGGGGHPSPNQKRTQGHGCMLFGASDKGETTGSHGH